MSLHEMLMGVGVFLAVVVGPAIVEVIHRLQGR